MDDSAAVYLICDAYKGDALPIGIERLDGVWQIQFIPVGADEPSFYVPIREIRAWIEV